MPQPLAPEDAPLGRADAVTVVRDLFGLKADEPKVLTGSFLFKTDGFVAGARCPLEGIRDTRCGEFAWRPSSVSVYRHSVIAAVSGHLARNRLVVVDMFSQSAGVSFSTLHGILVFPGAEVKGRDKPAFAWYLTRLGRSLGLRLADVTGDGALDLVYGYSQRFGGGLDVVARDVWTLKGMSPAKILSSGEKLSGVFLSTFDGVPLHDDGPTTIGRGTFTLIATGPGKPDVMLFEKARLAGRGSSWEVHVVADIEGEWIEYLTGAPAGASTWGTQVEVDGEPGPDCTPEEIPPGLGIEARRSLLDIESACRAARAASTGRDRSAGVPLVDFVRKLFAAARARLGRLPATSLALEESASSSLTDAWPAAWPLSVAISLHVAISAHGEYCRAFDPRFAECPERLSDTLWYFPAFLPLRLPFDRVKKALLRPFRGERIRLTPLGN
ncbi:MAG: hypothetical protein GXP54_12365 [Deltaproteobacteria bacterium]|nr:hypothetical protein [Deltaproteobacteria bacterium]